MCGHTHASARACSNVHQFARSRVPTHAHASNPHERQRACMCWFVGILLLARSLRALTWSASGNHGGKHCCGPLALLPYRPRWGTLGATARETQRAVTLATPRLGWSSCQPLRPSQVHYRGKKVKEICEDSETNRMGEKERETQGMI